MRKQKGINRRDFLGGAAAIAARLALPAMLARASQAAAAGGSDSIFVYVFLRGGADGLSLLGPKPGTPDYAVIDPLRNSQTKLTNTNAIGRINGSGFVLNPAAGRIRGLYNENRLAFVNGVGLDNSSRSHFVQQELIEAGTHRDSSMPDGFLSRSLSKIPSSQKSSSLPGATVGPSLTYSLRGNQGTCCIDNLTASNLSSGNRVAQFGLSQRLNQFWIPSQASDRPIEDLLRSEGAKAERAVQVMASAAGITTNLCPSISTTAGAQHYGNLESFRSAVRLLRAEPGIRILTIDVVGWDLHTNHGTNGGSFQNLLLSLDAALGAFAYDLKRNDLWEKTCIMVMSEFGRKFGVNNSNGLDHGRGGVAMVMGGTVRGGQVAQAPGYNLQTPNTDSVPVTTDYRLIAGEILTEHLGISTGNLSSVFPYFSYSPSMALNVIE